MPLENDGVDNPAAKKPEAQAQASLDIFERLLALTVANSDKDFISFNIKHTGNFR